MEDVGKHQVNLWMGAGKGGRPPWQVPRRNQRLLCPDGAWLEERPGGA